MSCLISFVLALYNHEEWETIINENFKMKIYASSLSRTSNPPLCKMAWYTARKLTENDELYLKALHIIGYETN